MYRHYLLLTLLLIFFAVTINANPRPDATVSFNNDWRFHLGEERFVGFEFEPHAAETYARR